MAARPGSRGPRFSTLDALRHREYRLLWGAFVVSNVGMQMQTFALGWFVVELATRDGTPQLAPLYLGLVAATRLVPNLLIGLVAGSVSDRMDRRVLLVVTNIAGGLAAAAFALVVLTDLATLPLVLVLSTLGASAQVFGPVTTFAMVPRLVPRCAIASAIGLVQTTQSIASLLGPLLGGALIGPIGVGGLMVCNALSYLAVVGAGLALGPVPVEAVTRQGSILRSMVEGFGYVLRHPVLRPLFLLTGALALAGRPYQQLLPAFAHDVLRVGALELSWLFAAAGAGAFAGSFVTATFGGSARRGRILALSAAALGAFIALFAFQRALARALLLIGVAALAGQVQLGLHMTTYQSTVPDELRGRVVAVSANVIVTSMSLGALLLGVVGSVVGVDLALAAGGVLAALAGIIVLAFVAPLRDSGREHAAVPVESPAR